MGEPTSETYDLEAVYDEKISPLMAQIIAICKEHRMPAFASFAFASNGDESGHCITYLHSDGRRPECLAEANRVVRNRGGRAFAFTITAKPAEG